MVNKQQSEALARAEGVFTASQQRDEAIKSDIAKEQAKVDAKTARLRALRLAKEAADLEAGIVPEGAAKKPARKKKAKADASKP